MNQLLVGMLGLIGALANTGLLPLFVLEANPNAPKLLLAALMVAGVAGIMCCLDVAYNSRLIARPALYRIRYKADPANPSVLSSVVVRAWSATQASKKFKDGFPSMYEIDDVAPLKVYE